MVMNQNGYIEVFLFQVLELSVGSQVRDELKVDGLINKFFMELTKSVSKLPASGLSCLFFVTF